MARDRKRAKQRRSRGGAGGRRPRQPAGTGGAQTLAAPTASPTRRPSCPARRTCPARSSTPRRRSTSSTRRSSAAPAACPSPTDHLSEAEIEASAGSSEGDLARGRTQEPAGSEVRGAPGGGGPDGGVARGAGLRRADPRRQPRDRLPARELGGAAARSVAGPPSGHTGNRSRARLRRVAGAYLGLADYVAKEIVEFIL